MNQNFSFHLQMPYILQRRRDDLDAKMKGILENAGNLSYGELNYIISNLMSTYVNQNRSNSNFNYMLLNNLMGVFECAKMEFYTRAITPYENTKLKENGAVYFGVPSSTQDSYTQINYPIPVVPVVPVVPPVVPVVEDTIEDIIEEEDTFAYTKRIMKKYILFNSF